MHGVGVVGCSYRHASADQLARFAIPKSDIEARLPELRAVLGGAEVLYLATCNRVEVLFAQPDGAVEDRRREVFRALTGREPVGTEAQSSLRTWTGEAALEHLFLVACGLDSAQAGEQEIYTQLRAAWQSSREAAASGPVLNRIVSEALSMARQAHRLGHRHAPSLADLAAERVLAHASGAGRDGAGYVALVGVSAMTRRCGAHLRDHGASILVVNRSLDPARELADQLSAAALSLEDFRRDPPAGCRAVILASGASEAVLHAAALQRLAPGRPLIVDFGLPPNVDPEEARAAGLERIGMDDLIRTARDGRTAHLVRLAPVRAAIDERLARLRGELAARAIGPQLAELRGTFERIAAAEMSRLLKGDLSDLDEARRARLAGWARGLAHRLAHLPLSGLRAAAEHASVEATQAFFREARLTRDTSRSDPETD